MRTLHTFARCLAVIGVGLAIATSASADPYDMYGTPEAILPSVTALSQKVKNDAVSITYAYFPQAGRLLILSGNPSKGSSTIVGSTDLSAGGHRDFKVPLNSQPKPGTRLWAAVEQAKSDQPFVGSDERAEQSFNVL